LTFFIFEEKWVVRDEEIFIRIKNFVKEKWMLLALLFIGMLLMLDPDMWVFKYDGMLYYSVADVSDYYSYSSLAYYGHMAQGSGLIITFFVTLMGGNTALGIYFANAFSMMAGGLSFYGILKKLAPSYKEYDYVLLTAIYVFSPYILGLGGYASVDYYCATLFLPVLYFTLSEKWFLQVLSGAIFSCTKEPGFLVYGMLCVGVLVGDFLKNRWKIISHYRYYAMAMVAFLWIVTLKFIGMWSAGDSGVGIKGQYIVEKIKALFILNYSWLFILLSILLIVFLIIKDKRKLISLLKKMGLIFVSFITFTIFSFILVTVNHARYTDIAPICLYLIFGLLMLEASKYIKKWVAVIVSLVTAIIMLMSSYFTIDPVSLMCFDSIGNGACRVVSLSEDEFLLGDHIIYNKQALWLEGAYAKLIQDSIENDRAVIIPAYNTSTYYFDGLIGPHYLKEGEYLKTTQYWDEARHQRKNVTQKEGTPFTLYSVYDEEGLNRVLTENDDKAYVYAWVEGLETGFENDILSQFKTGEEFEYQYRGWKIKAVSLIGK